MKINVTLIKMMVKDIMVEYKFEHINPISEEVDFGWEKNVDDEITFLLTGAFDDGDLEITVWPERPIQKIKPLPLFQNTWDDKLIYYTFRIIKS